MKNVKSWWQNILFCALWAWNCVWMFKVFTISGADEAESLLGVEKLDGSLGGHDWSSWRWILSCYGVQNGFCVVVFVALLGQRNVFLLFGGKNGWVFVLFVVIFCFWYVDVFWRQNLVDRFILKQKFTHNCFFLLNSLEKLVKSTSRLRIHINFQYSDWLTYFHIFFYTNYIHTFCTLINLITMQSQAAIQRRRRRRIEDGCLLKT